MLNNRGKNLMLPNLGKYGKATVTQALWHLVHAVVACRLP